jgi:hypothetical protein
MLAKIERAICNESMSSLEEFELLMSFALVHLFNLLQRKVLRNRQCTIELCGAPY